MATPAKSKPSFYKPILWVIFLVYSAILVKIIVIKDPRLFMSSLRQTWRHGGHFSSTRYTNWEPFKTIKLYLSSNVTFRDALENVGGNIIIFIPLGILLPLLLKGRHKGVRTIVAGALLSAAFEFFQLYTGCGQFDVDDIMLNTLGTGIGIVFFWGSRKWKSS